MGWFLSLVAIAVLIAFNLFAADAMVRMRRDILDIHKAVVNTSSPRPQPPSTTPGKASPSAPPGKPATSAPTGKASPSTST